MTYRSKMTHGINKKNFFISTADEFIVAITQHIREKSFQLVRYHGWYFNRMRRERRKLQEEVEDRKEVKENKKEISELTMIDVAAHKHRRIPPRLWREHLKKSGKGIS